MPKHFHGIWFDELSNLHASAVPLLRYVQAESELDDLIAGCASIIGQNQGQAGVSMTGFDPMRLHKDWNERARDLLRHYRRELLGDADFENIGSEAVTRKRDGKAAVD